MTFDDVPVGSIWKHYGGPVYEVILHANVEGAKEQYPQSVVYRNVDNANIYVRPLSEWARSFTRYRGGT